MTLLDLKLFLGFCPDSAFEKCLETANPYLVSLLMGNDQYLQQASHLGKQFLGKYLPIFSTLEEMENVERHIKSLLNKLAPTYSYAQNPLVLVTLGH